MGMYDYLGGEQIKIFYHPIFNRNKDNPEQSSCWYSMGRLQSFDKEDDLPLKTLWYQYPQNFLVYDYRFEFTDVWIINNGKFDRLVSFDKLTEEDLHQAEEIYDYHGTPIPIKQLSDFQQMKKDFNGRFEEINKAQKEVFPNGFRELIKENMEEYERLRAILDEKYEEIDEKYKNRWIFEEKEEEEANFGALLDCYAFTRSRKDEEPLKDIIIPAEDFQACKLTLQRMMKEKPDLVDRFKAWVNDEEMLQVYLVDELIEEINK